MINKLHVGNLAYAVTDDTLKGAFEQFGIVESAIVVRDKNSGKSKGFGFVEMQSENDAAQAVEKLNKTPLEGRVIFVSEAKSTGPFDPAKASASRPSKPPKKHFPGNNRGGFKRNSGFRKDFPAK